MENSIKARMVLDCKNTIGEGCFVDPRDGCLWWTDIQQRRVYRMFAERDISQFELPDRAGFILPRRRSGFVIGFPKRVAIANRDLTEFETLFELETEPDSNRINDAKVDPFGGIVFGTYNEHPDPVMRQPTANLYRISEDGTLSTLLDGILTSNGLAFSEDGKIMYFADTPKGTIRRFGIENGFSDFLELSPLAEEDVAPGMPDGSTVDSRGNYWSARVRGGCVVRISSEGKVTARIDLPVLGPTCVAFGGDSMCTLYITSLSTLSDVNGKKDSPLAGGVFSAKVDIPGSTQLLCTI